MKKALLLKPMLLLCALIVGISSAWGQNNQLVYNVSTTSSVTLASGTLPTGVTVTYSSTYGTVYQLTNGNSMTLTLKNFPYKVTNVSLGLKRNPGGGGAGTASVKHNNSEIGSETYASSSLSTSSYTQHTINCSDTQTSGDVVIFVKSTANSLWCNSFTITYQTAELQSISISGTYPTTFIEKDEFSHEGMTVTANYDDNSSKDVTSNATFSGYNMNNVGNQTVTVSYTEGEITKTATYGITVNAGTKYTVTFDAEGGSCSTASLPETEYMGGVTLPAATINVNGWVFAGWATASVTNTTTRPTLYKANTTYYPTANITLHAVYTLDGIDGEKYTRANSLNQIISAGSIIFVNTSKAIDHALGSVNAPTETNDIITPADNIVWNISGDNTNGFTLTDSENNTLGVNSIPSNYANVSLTNSNNKWLFVESTSGTNQFVLRNTELNSNSQVASLRYYSSGSKWQVYCLAASSFAGNANVASKIYVPVATAYNSNPSAVVTPTVAFTSSDDKTLYLDGTTTYTNAATVTEVSKTITYTSSNTNVATVNTSGVVTAVGIGEATITASVEAELGVSSAASDTYNVVVKSTTTIAGIKNLASSSTEVNFTADLTDAVVTYVKDNYAYIQDASSAIMVNYSDHGLTAGNKINGAVSGKVKAPNQIDQISSLNLDDATVTADGVIPAATVATLAAIKAAGTDYDGKLVTVNGATVTSALASTSSSGGAITDDEGTTSFSLYAPNKGITANETEEGNFTGFVSIYVSGNNTTYRLNLYEQSQFFITRNVATDQTLTFASYAFSLDEDTDDYDNFAGQQVSGAQGTVSYAKTSDTDNIITSLNTETGVVVLSGAYGTATITATAAATEVTESGVTTPYNETTKSYTITVYPRYTSTFSINGIVSVVRQTTHGATITVPTPVATIGDYDFMGWISNSGIDTPVDEAPSFVTPPTTPTNNVTYYAVYALGTPGGEENRTSTFTIQTSASNAPASGSVINGITWTYSGITFANAATACMSGGSTVTFDLPAEAIKAVSVTITPTTNTWAGSSKLSLPLTDKDDNVLTTFYLNNYSYNFESTNNNSNPYTITATTTDSKKAYINNIAVVYAVIGVDYSGYCTSVPAPETVSSTISASGWNTFSSSYALDLSTIAGGTAYVASDVAEGKVVLTSATGKVPAGTGLMIKGTPNAEFTINVTSDETTAPTNLLVGLPSGGQVPVAEEGYNYVFGWVNPENPGFYKIVSDVPTLGAEKAYLHTTTALNVVTSTAPFLGLDVDDETTGIVNVNRETITNNQYYTLDGRCVENPTKGLYIVNGKKVVIK